MYKLRLAKPEDTNFIVNSYLKSYRGSPESRAISEESYYGLYKKRLEGMAGAIVVATSQDDDDQILGYAIGHGSDLIIHYVYVKYPFRGLGLAKVLLKALCPNFGTESTVITHQPRNWVQVSSKYKLKFEPQHVRSL